MTGGWRWRAFTVRWMLFKYVLLCLGPNFQAEEELLGQTHIFKVLLVTGMSFLPPMNLLWL
jgi:hypothetical protein